MSKKITYQTKVNGKWVSGSGTTDGFKRSRPKKKAKPAQPAQPEQPVEVKKKRKKRSSPSKSFYRTKEWATARYKALKASDGKCSLCGRSASDGAILNVDHIKPVSKYPELKTNQSNLQVLCKACNWGKGAWDETDWRSEAMEWPGLVIVE